MQNFVFLQTKGSKVWFTYALERALLRLQCILVPWGYCWTGAKYHSHAGGRWKCVWISCKINWKLIRHVKGHPFFPISDWPEVPLPPSHMRINTQRLKICKSQQLEPQLILCYEDFKDHHLPDIHNKGIYGKETCIHSNEKIKTSDLRESGHMFFELHVFIFCFITKWSLFVTFW